MPTRSKTTEVQEVVHPGAILDQVLKEREMTQKDLSDAIGKSTPVINDIIKQKKMDGVTNGNVTLKKVTILFAPSTFAAS